MFVPQSRSLSLLCNSTCYESWRLSGRSHCQEIGTILIEFYRLNDGLRSVESVRLQLSKSQIDGVVLEKSKSRPNIRKADHLSCSLPTFFHILCSLCRCQRASCFGKFQPSAFISCHYLRSLGKEMASRNESMALLNSANATADTDAPSIQGASNLQRL